jgi:hypothetical protein
MTMHSKDPQTVGAYRTVEDHFDSVFPDHPFFPDSHTTGATGFALASMELDSECGDDCKAAIDAAGKLAESIRMAFGDTDPRLAIVANVVADVCRCYISG